MPRVVVSTSGSSGMAFVPACRMPETKNPPKRVFRGQTSDLEGPPT
jgi:hypothetical protein